MSPIGEPDLVQADTPATPATKTKDQPSPTHPGLIQVHRSSKPFGSGAFALVDLPAGAVFTRITGATTVPAQRYTTVQISRAEHIELNSDLVFCNHSCSPSVVFDMHKSEIRVVDDRPLKKGDALTFFYPSTEWEMDQPFDCTCGAARCKGRIDGAREMARETLEEYWLNEHVRELLRERDGA
jgi:hypothetical protein